MLDCILTGISLVVINNGDQMEKKRVKRSQKLVKPASDSPQSTKTMYSPGSKLIVTKPAAKSKPKHIFSSANNGTSNNADDTRTVRAKHFKPLPNAISNAISMRRRPVTKDYDPNLLRAYVTLLWICTSNRLNSCFSDSKVRVLNENLGNTRRNSSDRDIIVLYITAVIERLEILMDDDVPIGDEVFQLTSSPVICSPTELREKIFKGYLVAANTLSADIARYFLWYLSPDSDTSRDDTGSSSDKMSADPVLNEARERLSWLAAADVKYFIIPDIVSNIIGDSPCDDKLSKNTNSVVSFSATTAVVTTNNSIDALHKFYEGEDEDEI